ncbi:DUF1738 domain-containing protein [Arsenicitalea aurantiaca]|uniref:DUF1738 domain-containing protein n=1 Tax=Arsenicitalea aurantiaca TaxID=1783274 RepID=A0A433X7A8_9HYPH|nr:zincin-like metallopeptidase domain-containing protein [Arsenicitalea aurantiaca]RUT29954.1 DUF1738 domain-containing protein [Arsenicitalea aurantiaca]
MRTSSPPARRDLHAEITTQLIAAIEADPGNPVLPWRRAEAPMTLPTNARTTKPYNGVNIISLWCAAFAAGYTTSSWASYRQWLDLGAQVRKGEKGTPIIFYRDYDVEPDPENADDDGRRRVARLSIVFNADQVEGYVLPETVQLACGKDMPVPAVSQVASLIASSKAEIHHGGDEAYYDRRADRIVMPDQQSFVGTPTSSPLESYYSVLLHELAHWTGAPARLNRRFGERFGDDAYAAEELVAEIASAFLCAELQVTQSPRPDHAAYLAHWLKLLKSDNRALFTAAARASEAATYLTGLAAPFSVPIPSPAAS